MSKNKKPLHLTFFTSAFLLCLTLSPHGLCAQEKAEQAAPISIFDGKTLSGWKVFCIPGDTEKKFWSVHNGTIQCDSRGRIKHNYNWLIYQREFAQLR